MFPWKSGWSQDWYKGLLPKYARKGPSKKSDDQKEMLKEKLKNEQYTTSQVRDIIMEELGKEYTMKQVWYILKKMGMRHAKPYPHDMRRPGNADDILKKPMCCIAGIFLDGIPR